MFCLLIYINTWNVQFSISSVVKGDHVINIKPTNPWTPATIIIDNFSKSSGGKLSFACALVESTCLIPSWFAMLSVNEWLFAAIFSDYWLIKIKSVAKLMDEWKISLYFALFLIIMNYFFLLIILIFSDLQQF